MSVLHCQDLDLRIAGIRVATKLDLTIQPGQFWGLLGPNGIGKTTLLKCLAGLLEPASGAILLESRALLELPQAAGPPHRHAAATHRVRF